MWRKIERNWEKPAEFCRRWISYEQYLVSSSVYPINNDLLETISIRSLRICKENAPTGCCKIPSVEHTAAMISAWVICMGTCMSPADDTSWLRWSSGMGNLLCIIWVIGPSIESFQAHPLIRKESAALKWAQNFHLFSRHKCTISKILQRIYRRNHILWLKTCVPSSLHIIVVVNIRIHYPECFVIYWYFTRSASLINGIAKLHSMHQPAPLQTRTLICGIAS